MFWPLQSSFEFLGVPEDSKFPLLGVSFILTLLPKWGCDKESTKTLEILENDCKGQNTSHWRVIYIIRKLSKCRCLKWACMTHLDICNTSYGTKKDRKSNWQFDSQPQKVENWPNPCVCRWSVTHRWKTLLQLCFKPHLDRRFEQRVIVLQSYESPNLGNFETSPWES